MSQDAESDASQRRAATIQAIRATSRKNRAMHDLYLMLAAWNWPVELAETLLGATAEQLRAYRNQEAEVPAYLVRFVESLRAFHWWLWLAIGDRSYAQWWRTAIKLDDANPKLPIEIVRREGGDGIDRLLQHLKAWVLL